MDAMEKPPLIKPHVYIKFSVCAVLILVYCLMMFFAFYNAHRYTAAVPLELEAEIVKVEYVSTEDSGSYDAIMQYTHKGVITGQVFSDEDYIVSPFIKDDPLFAEYINKQLGICKTNLEKTKNAEDKSFSAQFEYLISIYEKFI